MMREQKPQDGQSWHALPVKQQLQQGQQRSKLLSNSLTLQCKPVLGSHSWMIGKKGVLRFQELILEQVVVAAAQQIKMEMLLNLTSSWNSMDS